LAVHMLAIGAFLEVIYTLSMSNDMIWKTSTVTAADTEALAERIGHALKGGEAIELVSDLGGGKTTFVRGLVRGLGSPDKVASPTFTISKMYKTEKLTVHHFDFYRLPEPGIMAAELDEVLGNPEDIVIVEWPEVVSDVLPDNRLTITFEQAEDGRNITFQSTDEIGYLIDAVKE
jgi:tRNA threonylcarbamoyl adenosine modification protein YjeE